MRLRCDSHVAILMGVFEALAGMRDRIAGTSSSCSSREESAAGERGWR